MMNRKHLAASLWRAVRSTADARFVCQLQAHLRVSHAITAPFNAPADVLLGCSFSRAGWVHTSTSLKRAEPAPLPNKMVQFPLAQTGEGIKECELIQWFVKVPATDGDGSSVVMPRCTGG